VRTPRQTNCGTLPATDCGHFKRNAVSTAPPSDYPRGTRSSSPPPLSDYPRATRPVVLRPYPIGAGLNTRNLG
jgi:hypothetical protein